ncbi:GNAT family N-acetyltransferase [Nanchangia anserum]|uniref:GNAT family N-acetyltransferase n=1 Tax=Nanchangia anserum TaxID=2692125 RepID=A0A8I0GC02_9ACTO|nr:GNAT family N-acetyltransferase [Nanchangia anserum]MBD3689380.1 GNAT family N-acetyltransferase [Nanchangia anserum]QOX81586.1 GNAT family N-acetyltransferase [Nanchangia anserum]
MTVTGTEDVMIRPARAGDEDQMVELTHVIARAEGRPEACTATTEGLRSVVIDDGWAQALVACEPTDPDTIIGMIIYYRSYASYAGKRGYFVENVAVAESAQGRGVASAMFDALVRQAKAEGVGKLEWACDRANSARRFYEDRLKAEPNEHYMIYSYRL